MRHLIALLTFIIAIAGQGIAQSDYQRIESKASRFFANEEWSSANAMYILMLEQHPRETDTYARAIVSYYMSGDTVRAVNILPAALSFRVPADSLLTEVRNISFGLGRGDLYENYLMRLQESFPWFSRVADNYLMQYYAFRQNGPELIRYAHTMLAGLPDNRNFLRMLATGLLLVGDTQGALEAWRRVVGLYPDDYDTILDLANCYDAMNNRGEALEWMRRAYALKPTPYVGSRIDALTGSK